MITNKIILEAKKASERMTELGMNPEQYNKLKILLKNNSISINDYNRLKNKAKRAGATTFVDFLNIVKSAKKEEMDIDEYLDNKIIEGKLKFNNEVENNLSSAPKTEIKSELSKKIIAKAPEIKKDIKNTPLPIAKRFFIKTMEKALEILGNAVNSHARIINKKDVDSGAEPKYKRTQTEDFHLNSEPMQVSIDGVIETAYELTIGKGQKKPSRIGAGSKPGEITNEEDEDRIRAFYLKEGEKTYGRTENEEGRKTVIRKMNIKFFTEFLHSKFYEKNFGISKDYSIIPQEQIKKAYRKYMLSIIKSRIISPPYSNANNTYYVAQNIFDSLKRHVKIITKPTNTTNQETSQESKLNTEPEKRQSWMAKEIEDWRIKHTKWTKLQKAAKENGGIEKFRQYLLEQLKKAKSQQEKESISQEINLLLEREPLKPNFNWLFAILRENNMNDPNEINAFKESPEYKKYEEEKNAKNINPQSEIGKKMFAQAISEYRKRIKT
jgi:hypothetical protein